MLGVTPTPITHLALSSGDSDLLPAVEAAKREGVVVWPVHGPANAVSNLEYAACF